MSFCCSDICQDEPGAFSDMKLTLSDTIRLIKVLVWSYLHALHQLDSCFLMCVHHRQIQ